MDTILHTQLADLVRNATEDVFTTMLGMDPHPQSPVLATTAVLTNDGIISIIGLTGRWVGTGRISCSTAIACTLASRLMMAEYDSVTDDVLDAIAEITNMIIGNVKTALEEILGPMGLSIPTVIHGKNFGSRTVGVQEWTIVPCLLDGAKLEVQICLTKQKEAQSQELLVTNRVLTS